MMRKTAIIAFDTFLDVARHKMISIHLIFLLIASGLFHLFGHFSTSPDLEYRMVQDVGISVITLFGWLMTMFIGVSTLREELNRKTAYTILTLPISRLEYYLGKFAGTLLATMVNVIIMILIFAGLLYVKFGVIWGVFFWIVFFMMMEFAIISSLVLLFSLTDSTTLAFSFTFFLVVLGNLGSYIKHLIEEAGIPGLEAVGKVLFLIVPNFSLFNIKALVLKELTIPWAVIGWASGYCLLYLLFSVGLGILAMNQRDL
jgi:ABC-type transport system involved in multi-copper enzyme maturation permease subunit